MSKDVTTVDETEQIQRRSNVVDIDRALRLRSVNGLSYAEIGEILGVSRQAVQKRVKPLLGDSSNDVHAFKKYKSDIVHAKQLEVMKALTPAKLKEASAFQLTGMFGILYDKARLEDGESTANVDVHTKVEEIKGNDAEMARLRAMLAEADGADNDG